MKRLFLYGLMVVGLAFGACSSGTGSTMNAIPTAATSRMQEPVVTHPILQSGSPTPAPLPTTVMATLVAPNTTSLASGPISAQSPKPDTLPELEIPAMPPTAYISRDLVVASIGEKPGQIGYTKGPGETRGPGGFTTDSKGNVYLIDQVNARINKYNSEGRYVSSLSGDNVFGSPSAITVWKDGSLFLPDWAPTSDPPNGQGYYAVKRIDPSGQLIKTYKWYGAASIEGLSVSTSGEIWVRGKNVTGDPVVQLGTVDASLEIPRPWGGSGAFYVRLCRDGAFFETRPPTVWFSDGRALNLFVPAHPDERANFESVFLVDTDADGNIFEIAAYSISGRDFDRRMLVYDPKGHLTGQVQLHPISYYTWVPDPIQVDEQGRIYEMLTFRDAVKIVRWEKK